MTSLTAEQRRIIHETFRKLMMRSDMTTELMYARIFELEPAARELFTSDRREQGRKFMQMVGTLVALMDMPGGMVPPLRSLGERHSGYKVRPEHFPIVGQALLYALERVLGEAFTPEVREAWTELYADVTDLTLAGMSS